MMATRPIQISTDVYAAIWADRKPGEETEEEILRRKFGVQMPTAPASQTPKTIGFRDPRFGIELEEGFEIFRTYRGVEYRAKARNNGWVLLSTNEWVASLNQLGNLIGTKTENAWNNWYYTGPDGKRRLVDDLRKQQK